MKTKNIDELTTNINKLLKRKLELQQELDAVSKQLIAENNKLTKLITGGTTKVKRKRKIGDKKDDNELKKISNSLNKFATQLGENMKINEKNFEKLEKFK